MVGFNRVAATPLDGTYSDRLDALRVASLQADVKPCVVLSYTPKLHILFKDFMRSACAYIPQIETLKPSRSTLPAPRQFVIDLEKDGWEERLIKAFDKIWLQANVFHPEWGALPVRYTIYDGQGGRYEGDLGMEEPCAENAADIMLDLRVGRFVDVLKKAVEASANPSVGPPKCGFFNLSCQLF